MQPKERVPRHRERLASLVVGGRAKQDGLVVHGKVFTVDQIDNI